METKKVFELKFLDPTGKERKITLSRPAEELDAQTAKAAMDAIVQADIFQSAEGVDLYAQAVSARYVVRSVEEVYDAQADPVSA